MARLLAIDYGSRRVGLALGDDRDGYVVTKPALVCTSAAELISTLRQIIHSDGVETVVVGLPVSLRGTDSAQTALTREFVAALSAAVTVPVVTFDERLTTKLAHRLGHRQEDDSASAALLLTNYLERRTHR